MGEWEHHESTFALVGVKMCGSMFNGLEHVALKLHEILPLSNINSGG